MILDMYWGCIDKFYYINQSLRNIDMIIIGY